MAFSVSLPFSVYILNTRPWRHGGKNITNSRLSPVCISFFETIYRSCICFSNLDSPAYRPQHAYAYCPIDLIAHASGEYFWYRSLVSCRCCLVVVFILLCTFFHADVALLLYGLIFCRRIGVDHLGLYMGRESSHSSA
jgi:hypothetical protein